VYYKSCGICDTDSPRDLLSQVAQIERIRVLSTEQLEALGEEFLSFSNVSDLVAWLEQNASS
jgi:hypothetical protein